MTLHWGFLPALAALTLLHYLFSAMALRAAAGVRLPLRESTLIQFTAAAASRITPGGFGAAAVNIRYLVCRNVPTTHAIAAAGAQHAVSMVSDGALCLIMVVLTPSLPLRTPGISPWMLAAIGGMLVIVLVLAGRRRKTIIETLSAIRELCRRPRDLLVTLLTCAGTTLTLSAAFALSVLAIPKAAGPASLPVLLACYFIGTSAGGAVPIPAGVGTTEAAMVTALAGAGVGAAHGLAAVLLFRAVTFWAPVPIGLYAARRLRRPSAGRSRRGARIPFLAAPARINPAREA